MKRNTAWFLILALFVSACSGGTTETAANETPTTVEPTATSAAPTTTVASTTTTAQATTTAVPTTTAAPTTTAVPTTTAAPTTTAVPTTTAAPTTTAQATTTAAPTTTAQATTTTLEIPGNPGSYMNCMRFSSTASAQDWFDWYYPYYGDVAGLDRNGDGTVCDPGDDWDPENPPWPPPTVVLTTTGPTATPTYPLPTGHPVSLEMLTAPAESDEDLCRIPQLPGSKYGGEGYTAFPVIFDNLQPDQNVRLATIPIDWDDHEGDPANLPAKHEHVQIFMDYYETASQGAVTFTPTFADRWYRLPESVSDYPQQYVSDFNPKLAQHGINAADDDLDFSQIDIVVFIFPNDAPIIAGYPPSPTEFATLQHFNSWTEGDERMVFSDEGWVRNYIGGGMYFEHPLRPVWSYYVHEAAHMFAMPDWYLLEASARLGSQQVLEIDFDWAAGPLNVWGVMSTQDGPSRTFVAWTRWMLGWLDDDQVDCYTIEQVQQHGSFDTELVPLDIYEPGTKAIIIRTGEYSGFLIESRRPVFPDHDIAIWETVERDPYGLIVYEIDATKPGATGTLSLVTPDGHDFKHMFRMVRQEPKVIDALFNVGNTATVQGIEIELLFTGDRDWVRISK